MCWTSNHQNTYRNGPRAHFPFKTSTLYIGGGVRLIELPQSIQSTLLIVFTLCIRSSPSLAFLHLESSPLFVSTSTRGVLDGLSRLRHTLGSLLPDGVPPERRDLGLLRRRWPFAPLRTIQAPGMDCPDVCREGSTSALRSRIVRATADSTARRFVPVFGDSARKQVSRSTKN
jgi:hypothetical protein